MAASVTSPVAALQAQIVALEATLAVCRAAPKPAAVHRFRSTSRRIQALLLLLEAQKGLPRFRAAADKLGRELRKLRRAAGSVRDADVHLKLLRSRLRRIRDEEESRAAHRVIDMIFAARQQAATKFHKLINAREKKIALRLEDLRKAVAPGEEVRLPATAYLDAAAVFVRSHAHLSRASRNAPHPAPEVWAKLSEDELHDLRKAAKLARYMLEPAPSMARTREAGKRFHAVQNAGGHWHDALELARASRRALGRNHSLTVALREGRNRYHGAFLRSLETLL